MSNILLLGPGRSTRRLLGQPFSPKTDDLWVVEKDDSLRPFWAGAKYSACDLRFTVPDLPPNHVDEVHAYELLNLLPGDAAEFFAFWRFLWDVLKPAGQVIASTPHWNSRWIHAYPGPQRVYTPELLAHLDRASDLQHAENFDTLWPAPYNFKPIFTASSEDGNAFYFRLAKC